MQFTALRVVLRPLEAASVPRYKGAMVRGAFGRAFRRVVCSFPARDCCDCVLSSACPWQLVFNTPRPPDSTIMRRYETVPHPYVIEPPENDAVVVALDEELTFGLGLVGRAARYLPYFLLSFEEMASRGMGAGRARFRVVAVTSQDRLIYDPVSATVQPPVPQRLDFSPVDSACRVRISFITPTRITYQGQMARCLPFHVLFRSLVRRIGLLAYFHDEPLTIDYRGLIEQSRAVAVSEQQLAPVRWRRFSGRQGRVLEVDGFTGTAVYEGELGPLLPFLRAGELLHVGKGTSFGMGKYRLEVA